MSCALSQEEVLKTIKHIELWERWKALRAKYSDARKNAETAVDISRVCEILRGSFPDIEVSTQDGWIYCRHPNIEKYALHSSFDLREGIFLSYFYLRRDGGDNLIPAPIEIMEYVGDPDFGNVPQLASNQEAVDACAEFIRIGRSLWSALGEQIST